VADAGRASSDVWHRSLEDLLQAIETAEASGAGRRFVINLQTSAAPIAPPPKGFPQFDGLRVYQLSRRNERSAQSQFHLRLGIIASDLEADAILAAVRAHYPSATKAAVDEEDRNAIARAPDPVRPVDTLPPHPTPPTPVASKAAPTIAAASESEPQAVEDLRWDIDELLPDLSQTFPSGRNPSAPPATPTRAQPEPQMTAQSNVRRRPQTAPPVVPKRAVSPQAEPTPPKPVADGATVATPAARPPHSASRIRPPTELRPSLRPTLARAQLARRLDVTATAPPPRATVHNGHAPHSVSPLPPRVTAAPERAIAPPPPERAVAPPERTIAAPDRVAASPEREVAPPADRAAAAPEHSVAPPRLAHVPKDEVQLGASARAAPDPTADSGTLQSVVARIGTLIDAVEARAEGAAAALRAARARTASARTASARTASARTASARTASARTVPGHAAAAHAATPSPAAPEPAAFEPVRPPPSAPPVRPSALPAASARAASVELDSTRTVRALTALELEDTEASRWFAIQVMRSAEQIDAEQVPNLDIFSEYRLYSVAEADGDGCMQTLRVGFFSSEVAAQAVAGYLSTYFPGPEIKRVSIAEHERFAEKLVVALKDVGAAGHHAVIEVAPAPPPLEVRVEAAPLVDNDKRSTADSGSFWSRLKALRAQK
jgi:hypothetical protein